MLRGPSPFPVCNVPDLLRTLGARRFETISGEMTQMGASDLVIPRTLRIPDALSPLSCFQCRVSKAENHHSADGKKQTKPTVPSPFFRVEFLVVEIRQQRTEVTA